jgi:hypothetical protein
MRFAIEIDDDWLDTLDDLTAQVEAQGDDSPEQALEQNIFAQLKEQRNTALAEPRPVLSARPFLIATAFIAFVSQAAAYSLGRLDLGLSLTGVAIVVALLVLVDCVLEQAARS